MADIKTPEERSRNMAEIRSKDTKPEIYFRKQLFARGFRYYKNYSGLPGHPDIYLAKYHTAIFIHGCFWHRHEGCKYAYMPKSNTDFWKRKFEANITRDRKVRVELQEQNIRCLIIWECTIREMKRNPEKAALVLRETENFLRSNQEKYREL